MGTSYISLNIFIRAIPFEKLVGGCLARRKKMPRGGPRMLPKNKKIAAGWSEKPTPTNFSNGIALTRLSFENLTIKIFSKM